MSIETTGTFCSAAKSSAGMIALLSLATTIRPLAPAPIRLRTSVICLPESPSALVGASMFSPAAGRFLAGLILQDHLELRKQERRGIADRLARRVDLASAPPPSRTAQPRHVAAERTIRFDHLDPPWSLRMLVVSSDAGAVGPARLLRGGVLPAPTQNDLRPERCGEASRNDVALRHSSAASRRSDSSNSLGDLKRFV